MVPHHLRPRLHVCRYAPHRLAILQDIRKCGQWYLYRPITYINVDAHHLELVMYPALYMEFGRASCDARPVCASLTC
jgi:hypothetical protein